MFDLITSASHLVIGFFIIIADMGLAVVFGAGFTKLIQTEAFGDSVFFSNYRFRQLVRHWHLGEHENGAISKTPEQIGQMQADARLAQALATKSLANAGLFVFFTAVIFFAIRGL